MGSAISRSAPKLTQDIPISIIAEYRPSNYVTDVTAVTGRRTPPANTVTNVTTDTALYSPSITPEELLAFLDENGMIDMRGVRDEMRKAKKQNLLKQHSYAIYQGKDGRWYSYLPDQEKGRKKIVKATREQLEDVICRHYEVEANPTLRTLFPAWMKYKELFVKKASLTRFRTDWKKFYEKAAIVDVPIRDLSKNKLEIWVRTVAKEYNMDKKQYSNFVSILKQELEYAEELEIIQDSPFRRIKVTSRQLRSPSLKPDYCKVYSHQELIQLKEMAWDEFHKGTHKVHKLVPLAVMFMFLTGLRIGEIAGLKFSDIFDSKMLIRRMVQYPDGEIIEDTKGDFGQRFVLLVPEALELIETARTFKEDQGVDNEFIFSMSDRPILTYFSIQRTFREYCKKMGIVIKSAHKARMTYISSCIDEGINAHTVAKQVGHKDVRTTLNNYYYDRNDEAEQISRLQAALCG